MARRRFWGSCRSQKQWVGANGRGARRGGQRGFQGSWEELGKKAQLERGMREGITSASCPRRRGELGSRPQAGPCQEEGNVGLRREKGRLWGGC